MSRVTANWVRLRASYYATIGASPVLAIGAITNKGIVVGTPGNDFMTNFGGLTNMTTFQVQALGSDFPTNPTKGAAAVVTGMPSDIGTLTRQVISSERRDGVIYITLGDLSGKT
jgi:hypothetical protein